MNYELMRSIKKIYSVIHRITIRAENDQTIAYIAVLILQVIHGSGNRLDRFCQIHRGSQFL